jgi:hypothetical protein
MLARTTGSVAAEATSVPAAGLLTSFIAPFVGMVHAKLRGPPPRRSKSFDGGTRPFAARRP